MSSTLSLAASKKVFEIVGLFDTEVAWVIEKSTGEGRLWDKEWIVKKFADIDELYAAPTFAELVRVLVVIGLKKGWNRFQEEQLARDLSVLYMSKMTEPLGMAAVETHLMMKLV